VPGPSVDARQCWGRRAPASTRTAPRRSKPDVARSYFHSPKHGSPSTSSQGRPCDARARPHSPPRSAPTVRAQHWHASSRGIHHAPLLPPTKVTLVDRSGDAFEYLRGEVPSDETSRHGISRPRSLRAAATGPPAGCSIWRDQGNVMPAHPPAFEPRRPTRRAPL